MGKFFKSVIYLRAPSSHPLKPAMASPIAAMPPVIGKTKEGIFSNRLFILSATVSIGNRENPFPPFFALAPCLLAFVSAFASLCASSLSPSAAFCAIKYLTNKFPNLPTSSRTRSVAANPIMFCASDARSCACMTFIRSLIVASAILSSLCLHPQFFFLDKVNQHVNINFFFPRHHFVYLI